jgi:murein L,D-transpeptidase YcbB/YkuD
VKRINRIAKGIISLVFVFVFLYSYSVSAEIRSSVQTPDTGLGLLIQKKIKELRSSSKTDIRGEYIYSSVLVESFYKGRNYSPGWSQNGHLAQADALIRAVEDAYGDGLTPDYYHLSSIKSLVSAIGGKISSDQTGLADLDILLTDAFLTLSCHLSGGCVNPVTLEEEWFAKRRDVDVSAVLEQALRKKQIRESLMKLRPEEGSYGRLKQALALYRDLASRGQWPLVSGGPLLKKGSVSDRVVELRRRLFASGDLEAEGTKGRDFFGEELEQAVVIFQKRHGLKQDGIVGPETLRALNVPLKERIRQIEVNMERLRWMSGNGEQRSIVVNIANFRLDVIEDRHSVLSMKVVVGKPYQRTPVFTAKMTYLIINPPWNVPDSIAREEILKKIRKDPQYLLKENIKVLTGWGPQEKEIDPETIDWSKISANNLPYRFRQEPGPLNPLGQIKFMFPNKFNVYLHDTPAKQLFSKDIRTFSHGCTRVEKPVELAEYLFWEDPQWTREKLLAAIEEGTEQEIRISRPLNVHFLYLTAWVDEEGILQFRNDIYERDALLDAALRKKPTFQ